jgi:PiT family inorganic phosphate transporter
MGNLASIPLGWVIVPASIVAAGATFAVGANDAANALGTSVGARSLSLRSAIVLGACMEFLGIVALGAVVGSTLRNGIINPEAFPDPRYFVVGMFSVLCASFAWLLVATLLGLPVSTTHTIVAGIAAFGIFEVGAAALQVNSVVIIAVSWVVSPVSGFVAALLLYWLLDWLVIRRRELSGSCCNLSHSYQTCSEKMWEESSGGWTGCFPSVPRRRWAL